MPEITMQSLNCHLKTRLYDVDGNITKTVIVYANCTPLYAPPRPVFNTEAFVEPDWRNVKLIGADVIEDANFRNGRLHFQASIHPSIKENTLFVMTYENIEDEILSDGVTGEYYRWRPMAFDFTRTVERKRILQGKIKGIFGK